MNRLYRIITIVCVIFCFHLSKAQEGKIVSQKILQNIYEEVKTPYKFGLVMVGENKNSMVDCPTIFQKDGKWYMSYLVFDGRGYETWLATSEDLLEWNTLGRLLSFSDKTDWDADQKGGYIALTNTEWEGGYELNNYDGKYWMSYFGSNVSGYEAGDLSVGIAYTTKNPILPHEWQRLPQSVLSPKDTNASWWDNDKIYKNSIIQDSDKLTGYSFLMYYNAKGDAERIGLAVSNDMVHWTRYGTEPLLDHGNKGITGDAYLQKIGDVWVMFYFGAFWNKNPKIRAWNSFACSYDLIHWSDWTGQPLVQPSEPFDAKYAHKSCVIKHNGIVFHYYCAVDEQGNRGIALATSKDLGESGLKFPIK